jgi:TfoX/Sxy family transcriptional regulator of competence genes
MAVDEALAERIRATLASVAGITERRMFGGLAFMHHGHMLVGIANDALMVRVGPDRYEASLAEPGAREMDFTGRPMKGYVFVDGAGHRTDQALAAWVARAREFVATLPPKT